MALAPSEVSLLSDLYDQLSSTWQQDELLRRYYKGAQRLKQLGMAIPPEMRRFVVIVNWCRVQVDTVQRRQKVRALVLPGQDTADPQLRAIWDNSDMHAQMQMFNRDRQVFGRSYMSVGTGGDPKLPTMRVESPREMSVQINTRDSVAAAAARFYGQDRFGVGPRYATLMTPGTMVQVERVDGKYVEIRRARYAMEEIPVFMHLNRRMTGEWSGESEMSDMIGLVDAAARTMTNMQFAVESHGIPRMWMTGVAAGDFTDAKGAPIPQWEAYYNAIHTLTNKDASIGQLSASDLKNFETAMRMYGGQAATLTGFPGRYFGLHTSNPPAEGAMRADESQLVEGVEGANEEVGTTLGWAASLAAKFAGIPVEGNQLRVDWHDPGTPTQAQRMDALTKARAVGVLSREGFWDELGWSEARKAKERAYFTAEESDPYLDQLEAKAAEQARVSAGS